MSKNFLLLILIFVTANSYAQVVNLNGKITVENKEESTVHIFNSSANHGVLSQPSGEFTIAVKENDTLIFSSVQYKKLQVIISDEIIKASFLEVVLVEAVNELSEVKIRNIDLTGHLSGDIENLSTEKLISLKGNFTGNRYACFDADLLEKGAAPVDLASGENTAGEGESILKLGIGVGAIARLFGIQKRSFTSNFADEVMVELKKDFNQDFFISQLRLTENEIPEFINYLIENNIPAQLLAKKNKLALIEFMIEKSKQYKKSIKAI